MTENYQKRKSYSVRFKLRAVDYARKKKSICKAAIKFNMARSRVREWCRREASLREIKDKQSKHLKGAGWYITFTDVNEQLTKWILEIRAEKERISRRMIQIKARELLLLKTLIEQDGNSGFALKASLR